MNFTLQEPTSEFLAHRDALAGFILGLTRDTHVAEDIFQEVWLRFAKALEGREEIRNVFSWSRTVARRLVIDHWRKNQSSQLVFNSELAELMEQAFDEQDSHHDIWRDRLRALEECVKNLPDYSKEILRLKYEKNYTAREEARETNRTVNAVLMALSRLRQILAQCVSEKLGERETV